VAAPCDFSVVPPPGDLFGARRGSVGGFDDRERGWIKLARADGGWLVRDKYSLHRWSGVTGVWACDRMECGKESGDALVRALLENRTTANSGTLGRRGPGFPVPRFRRGHAGEQLQALRRWAVGLGVEDHERHTLRSSRRPRGVPGQIPRDALQDALTGLANRALMLECLQHAFLRDRRSGPILATGDRCAIGAEALVRWVHPTRGPVSPGMVIPPWPSNLA
jgi:hypothetical protein